MKKSYIIGTIILLSVIDGSVVAYEYGNSPKVKKQEGLSYYKDKNYQKALPLFEEAAEQGNAQAENNLGYIYAEGLGVPQDYNKALYWYKKSAEQGFKPAENLLKSLGSKP